MIDIFDRLSKDIPPTHYNTLGGMLSEYLNMGDKWYLKSFGWCLLNSKPVHATLIGEAEPERVKSVQVVEPELDHTTIETKEPEYYPRDRGRFVGD